MDLVAAAWVQCRSGRDIGNEVLPSDVTGTSAPSKPHRHDEYTQY